MPTSEGARRDEIATKANDSVAKHSVHWQNDRLELPVINLSVDSVLLNPTSHRIRAQIESHPKRDELEEDPFSESAQRAIETILSETSGFTALADNLRETGQLEPGIITSMGSTCKWQHAGCCATPHRRTIHTCRGPSRRSDRE